MTDLSEMAAFCSLPRADRDKLPLDCEGCGACCGPCLEKHLSKNEASKWLLNNAVVASFRGMSLKDIGGEFWICSPPCRHLGEDGRCKIYSLRPRVCDDFKRGCDTCRILFIVNGGKKNG